VLLDCSVCATVSTDIADPDQGWLGNEVATRVLGDGGFGTRLKENLVAVQSCLVFPRSLTRR